MGMSSDIKVGGKRRELEGAKVAMRKLRFHACRGSLSDRAVGGEGVKVTRYDQSRFPVKGCRECRDAKRRKRETDRSHVKSEGKGEMVVVASYRMTMRGR